jgi:hypothetical protein
MTTRLVLDDAVCSMLLYVAVGCCMSLYCTCLYDACQQPSSIQERYSRLAALALALFHHRPSLPPQYAQPRMGADVAQEVAVGPSVTLAALASFVVRFCLGSDVSC